MGGKGGSKIEVSNYQMSLHIGICLAPVDAIIAAYYGEKKYWSGYNTDNTTYSISQRSLFGGAKKEGGIEGNMTFLMGKSDQVIPDWFAQKLGRSSGAQSPGFRGVTSVIHTGPAPGGKAGWMWCSNSPYLKSMWYTAISIPRNLGDTYSRLLQKRNVLVAQGSPWKYKVVDRDDTSDYSSPSFDDSSWDQGMAPFGDRPWPDVAVSGTTPADHGFSNIPATVVPQSRKVWMRSVLNLPAQPEGYLKIETFIDNDCSFWVNGTLVATRGGENGAFYEIVIPASVLRAGGNHICAAGSDRHSGSGNWFYFDWRFFQTADAASYDANPAHIIYQVLTDGEFGMGLDPSSAIDVESFTRAAKTLYEEGVGLSMAWSTSTAAQDFIDEVKGHINALMFTDPRTGKIVIKLIRDDYDKSSLRSANPDNCKVTSFSRKAWGDTINEIVVTWTNPDTENEETVTLQDNGNIAEQGEVISDSRNYYGARSSELAWKLAERELRVVSSPLSSAEIELSREFWDIKPGDCLKLTYPEYGISSLVMRVWEVKYGKRNSSKITISVTEDVFSLPVSAYVKPPSTEWVDVSATPRAITDSAVITLPAFAVATVSDASLSQFQYPVAYAGVLAAPPNDDTTSFDLMGETVTTTGSLTWEMRGTKPVTAKGKLTSSLVEESVSMGVSLGVQVAETMFVFIGSGGDGEMEISLVQSVSGSQCTLRRGVLDTVPKAWSAGTPCWIVSGDFVIADETQQSAGSNPDYKLLSNTSRGQLDIASAPILTTTLSDRLHAPLRPANIVVNGIAFGVVTSEDESDVVTTFSRRNRLLEEKVVLSWADGDVAPETGQTVEIDVINEATGAVIKTISGLTGVSGTIPVSDVIVDADPDGYSRVYLDFYAANNGMRSIQAHRRLVKFKGGFQIITESLPYVFRGGPYSQTIQRTGGLDPIAWSISAGTLPSGLAIGPSTGTISGTATSVAGATSNFTVKGVDAGGRQNTKALSILTYPADEYFDSVALLLKMEGANDGSVFTDSSFFKNPVAAGSVKTKTGRKKVGTSSAYFPGNTKLDIPAYPQLYPSSSWSIEVWVYPESYAGWRVVYSIQQTSSVPQFGSFALVVHDGVPKLEIKRSQGESAIQIVGTAIPLNQWTHLEVSCDAGYGRLFIDGQLAGTNASLPSIIFEPVRVSVGGNANGFNISTECWIGNIDELRVRNRVGHVANFTPPIDEFPIYGDIDIIADPHKTATVGKSYSAEFFAKWAAEPVVWTVESGALPSGLTLTTTGTKSAVVDGTVSATVGNYSAVIKATDAIGKSARYKMDFAVGTLVSLLHFNGPNGSATFTDESGKTWAVNGDAKISTATYPYGSSSGYFDGSGDSLSINSDDFTVNVDDYTVEMWLNPSAFPNPNYHIIFDTRNTSGSNGMLIYATPGGVVRVWSGTGGSPEIATPSGALPIGKWTHVALVRKSGMARLFIDGLRTGNVVNGSGSLNAGRAFICQTQEGGNNFNGYVKDFRFVRGAAFYWLTDFQPTKSQLPG